MIVMMRRGGRFFLQGWLAFDSLIIIYVECWLGTYYLSAVTKFLAKLLNFPLIQEMKRSNYTVSNFLCLFADKYIVLILNSYALLLEQSWWKKQLNFCCLIISCGRQGFILNDEALSVVLWIFKLFFWSSSFWQISSDF